MYNKEFYIYICHTITALVRCGMIMECDQVTREYTDYIYFQLKLALCPGLQN